MRLILFILFNIILVFYANQTITAQVKFAVIGCYGDESTYEAAVSDMIDTWNVDFVITLGDNNYNNGTAATIDQNIGKDYNQWIYPYNGSYLPGGSSDNINRFFPSLGNHDYNNTTDPNAAQPYLDYFVLPGNERWYSFSKGNIDFFVLDSQLGWITETLAEQWTWLQNEVANSTAQWKVVYFHHPPYSSRYSHTRMRLDFNSLNIDLVLAAHDHLYERLEIDGLTYIVNGLGGKSIYATNPPISGSIIQYNGDYGAMLVEATESTLTSKFYNRSGDLIDTWSKGGSLDITVTVPNGGEIWQAGSFYQIKWNDGISENVKIELYKNGIFDSEIIESTPSDGSKDWTIPSELTPGDEYKIKITSVVDNNIFDFSDLDFSITATALPPVVNNGAGFALDFDGINDYVLIPDDSSLDITSNITLEAWVKPDEVSTQYLIKKAIFGSSSSNYSGYELSLSYAPSGTKFFFRLNQQESGNEYRLNSNTQYQPGIWTHIATTYDGTTMRIYINGVEDNSLSTSPTVTINSNTLALGLGAQSNGGSSFNGQMDEVRVWNIARTEIDIKEYMCKKLTGSESGLVGYWRFDETQGLTLFDATTNHNDGTMTNMVESAHIWSSATLGDDIVFDYDPADGYTSTLSHNDGDNFTATTASGTISGIQVYRVDDNSVRSGSTVPTNYIVDSQRYWGVRVIGTDNSTYDIVYNYNGHHGIFTETDLKLVKRNDISDPNWVDAGASLDVNAHTLSLTAQSGTEYALASISDPLPVELSSFNAKVIDKDVHLYWQTVTEVNNYGFNIERTLNNSSWIIIGFVEGYGNSNATKNYNFSDTEVEQSGHYYYRLKQLDNVGTFEYSHTIEVTVGVPDVFYLSQNYPNPFNPFTIINYQITELTFVTLKVFDVLGKEVLTLISEEKTAGSYTVELDGSKLTSGIYFYRLIAGNFVETKSMMLMK
jgi:hypothetical protein